MCLIFLFNCHYYFLYSYIFLFWYLQFSTPLWRSCGHRNQVGVLCGFMPDWRIRSSNNIQTKSKCLLCVIAVIYLPSNPIQLPVCTKRNFLPSFWIQYHKHVEVKIKLLWLCRSLEILPALQRIEARSWSVAHA